MHIDKTFALQELLQDILLIDGNMLVVGYAPLVLISLYEVVDRHQFQLALMIGLQIGFSHAPVVKH